MTAAEFPVRSASYVPCRSVSGTFPVSKTYRLRQMLYNYDVGATGRVDDVRRTASEQVIPSFPFSDVPVYADTVDIETLAFHDFWGCLLTPDNVAARICTDDLRYHVWVATKRVVESGCIDWTAKEALLCAVMNRFMVELGLVLLDLCPGPLVLFVDPRLQDDAALMVSNAMAMVAQFDAAHVRRWRIVITVPATEEGICAAQELVHRHGVQIHLSLVSCLAHATACISTGAQMVSMSVGPIMEWFEHQQPGSILGTRGWRDHPGIETIQSCATYIDRHGLNTTLLMTDMRKWPELKALSGVGAIALKREQLDQIPMRRVVTWLPRLDDQSRATLSALSAPPPHFAHDIYPGADGLPTKRDLGVLASLPAESRSLVAAVLYMRLRKMAECMETIERVVRAEIRQRIKLETLPLEALYRRPSTERVTEKRTRRATERSRSTSRKRREKRSETPMVEGIDYF